jgi:hypothetical protein
MASSVEPIASRPAAAADGGRRWTVLNRKVHYFLGLYLLFFIWLFALTGLILNHSALEFLRPKPVAVAASWEKELQQPLGNNTLADAKQVMRELGIAGEIQWLATPATGDRFDFRVNRPGTNYDIKVDLKTSRAAVQRSHTDTWSIMRLLHTFTGVRATDAKNNRDWILTTIWALSMDAVAIGLLVTAATGAWIWFAAGSKRLPGFIALATGFIVCGWLVVGLRWLM